MHCVGNYWRGEIYYPCIAWGTTRRVRLITQVLRWELLEGSGYLPRHCVGNYWRGEANNPGIACGTTNRVRLISQALHGELLEG